ncbi:MAG TPA: hypothetical protein VLR49_14490 [Ferruginibacter sp.]|nr:hypothetical protein [Ferruginibacter sp.]
MSQDEKFSHDENENLRIENELLRIQLKAQYGDAFHMETNAELSPEIENQFLKTILAFEENSENAELTTVYEKIGKPSYKSIGELSPAEISVELNRITAIMEEHHLGLDICDGPYPDEEIYKFITEELFAHEIEVNPVFGMGWNFIYEEFHPNNKVDITKNTHRFFEHWLNRNFDEYSAELDYEMITADGKQMRREELYKKMNHFFESFERFDNDGYNIDLIEVKEQEDGTAMGFSEGMYKYDALMENGELIHFEGPYKLYMRRTDNYWGIFYFVMPGFKW